VQDFSHLIADGIPKPLVPESHSGKYRDTAAPFLKSSVVRNITSTGMSNGIIHDLIKGGALLRCDLAIFTKINQKMIDTIIKIAERVTKSLSLETNPEL